MGDDRPNVVVILADDMGWGDLGCYGATKIPTPAMDRLAAEGVRATDCHSASAVCTPSRYALLTGRYAWRGPLKRWVLPGHGPAIIEEGRTTLASLLREAGYSTGAFGKWHLGLDWAFTDGRARNPFGPAGTPSYENDADARRVDYGRPFRHGPLDLGFERFFGIAGSLDMPPYCFLSQDRTVGIPTQEKEVYHPQQRWGLQVDGWDDRVVDERFVAEACTWTDEAVRRNRPFFTYLALSAPHRPCVPPPFAAGRSAAGLRGDMVTVVDWAVGEVLDQLDRLGVAENSLVVLTSDNGARLADVDGDTHGHRSNGPWRGQKADIWEAGHREPLLVRWPGHLPAGNVNDGLMCLSDVLATVAAAAGVPVPRGAGEDSLSLLSTLAGLGPSPRSTLVHHSGDGMFSYRSGRWKLVLGTGSGGFSEPAGAHCNRDVAAGQLYDLAQDPGEQDNLWDANPEVVGVLYNELKVVASGPESGLSFDVRP